MKQLINKLIPGQTRDSQAQDLEIGLYMKRAQLRHAWTWTRSLTPLPDQ